MPTVIDGQRGTAGTDGVLAARRVKEVHNSLMYLEREKNPFLILATKAGSVAVDNPDFDVQEIERIPAIDRINGGNLLAGSTTLTVDNGAYFPVNSLVQVQRTGETMLCTGVSGDDITVTRSWGTVAAAALLDNDQLSILGGAALEGADAEASKTVKATEYTNYCQIIRRPFQLTGTLMASKLYGENDMATQTRMAGIHHAVDIEESILFGEKVANTSGDTPRRSTDGLATRVSTNSTDFGGSFNWNTFSSATEDWFRYGSPKKTGFCARGVRSAIGQEAMTTVRRTQSEKTFGLRVNMLETDHGEIMLVTHNLLEGDTYGKYMIGADLKNVGWRFLRGRNTSLRMDIGTPGVDGKKHEFLSEGGLFAALEKTHFLGTNMA